MRKVYKYFIFVLFITFMFDASAIAESCDNKDINGLKELSKRVTYDYEYVAKNGDNYAIQGYVVKFNGLGDEFYVLYDDVLYRDNVDIYVMSGKNTFNIYSTKCDMKVRSINVDLLKYNEYSLSDYCYGLKDKLEVCGEWYQGNITYSELEKVVDEYYDGLEEEDSTYDKAINFVISYKFFIIPFIIGLIFVIASIRIRRNRLD